MKKIAFPLIVAAMGLVASAAHAAPASNGGVLTITGQLTANTCTVSGNGQGNNFAVTLPTLSAATLSAAGSTAGSTGFNIALSACTPSTGTVHTFWEYGANTLADGNLRNNGTAANVEVQLVDYNGTQKVLDVSKADGAQNAQTATITGGSANLQYAAQYVSPAGGATAGSVTTNVTYSMIYQ
ncbi:type 1 fimbrial protein [Paraburkholderia sp. SIMBA_055]|jgi:major type 1 subunit fimbrin (pilin)|uniref:Major type 1 subunit fimbrin (Pilin) n=1 Tax=Paraburkholderia graminis TaxID=60548 RepID=A0ABD5CR00_9BURK|nr:MULTISPECIES: fimbrial protein [Paraburkholderia]AXF07208.1 type 1 fimbrial protein [Paraburkholderia graminis]MDQ0622167.1 major type 1 subunit fimbrin (pilin) [Paraburkholderia graminis]MDR6207655.1 major type 1 subunit fimbrin (pilin) [Paraburkholderia graminis]MDR6468504.1 major type 1 subunit fimbrin (pilin) [Paraburkholderia graminis]MDR6477159.1 major type 1 subunit fimbrin (pilin) [Paraburkholderia graminis]